MRMILKIVYEVCNPQGPPRTLLWAVFGLAVLIAISWDR
jgi:hypothetical protein